MENSLHVTNSQNADILKKHSKTNKVEFYF